METCLHHNTLKLLLSGTFLCCSALRLLFLGTSLRQAVRLQSVRNRRVPPRSIIHQQALLGDVQSLHVSPPQLPLPVPYVSSLW